MTSGYAIGLLFSFLVIKKMKKVAKSKRLLDEKNENNSNLEICYFSIFFN